MKLLPLTKDKFALVDDDDYYWLSQWNWFAVEIKNTWYARRSKKKGILRSNEKYEIYLHRIVMRCSDIDFVIDHLDKNGLNNQKENLRICTKSENNKHTSSHKNSSSQYLGVSYDKNRNKWSANLMNNGKRILFKRYNTEIEAAKAYDITAKTQFGVYANLNFK
jgi:hypothetical protein